MVKSLNEGLNFLSAFIRRGAPFGGVIGRFWLIVLELTVDGGRAGGGGDPGAIRCGTKGPQTKGLKDQGTKELRKIEL